MKNKKQGQLSLPFYAEEKIALFIDGVNLYAASRALEFDIDYRRLLSWVSGKSKIVRAFYYTALVEDQEYSPIKPLIDWLDYDGYAMVTKPVREYSDSQGRKRVKTSMDVELAVDMMELAESVDHVLLFSGDGSFKRLVEAVQRKGVRVTVISTVKSNPPMVADDLRRQADHSLDLDHLASFIMRAHDPADLGGSDEDDLEHDVQLDDEPEDVVRRPSRRQSM